MKKTLIAFAISAATLVPSAAFAQTVYNTSLQNVNGPAGTNNATTTTDGTGTRTTVTGTGSGRASATPVFNQWYQANIGAGSTVGITTDFARNGNGSAYFSQTQSNLGKGDLVYNFGFGNALAPIALSALTSYSFDHYRSSTSTNDAIQSMVLRLDMFKDGVFAGSLVQEPYYTTNGNEPLNTWTTTAGDLNTGNWWATNSLLGPTFATAGGVKTLAQWIAANSGSSLSVFAVEVGYGSGWQGTFVGAADNVSVQFGQSGGLASNFEVAAAGAVPEPATWAMMLFGFGAMGGMMRARNKTTQRVRYA